MAVLLTDVVSKLVVVTTLSEVRPTVLVPHVLDLLLTRNPGAAFGIATGATIVFTVVAVMVVVAIVRLAGRLRRPAWGIVLGALLGGALGNLSDRLFRAPGFGRGHVVDWIHLHHWPIFNVADAAIVLGGVAALLLVLRGISFDDPPASDGTAPTAADAAAGTSERP